MNTYFIVDFLFKAIWSLAKAKALESKVLGSLKKKQNPPLLTGVNLGRLGAGDKTPEPQYPSLPSRGLYES